MSNRRGFVLVSALGVTMLVLVLGLGMSFVSQANLDIAANLRSNTEARYRAEAGIDHALAVLRSELEADGQWHSSLVQSSNYAAEVSGYTAQIVGIDSPNLGAATQVRVTSKGYAPRKAEYIATAIISRPTSTPQALFSFTGLRTPGRAVLNANTTLGYQSGLYAGAGIEGGALQNGLVSTVDDQGTLHTIPGEQSSPPPGVGNYLSVGQTPTVCIPAWVCDASLRTNQSVSLITYQEVLGRELKRLGVIPQNAPDNMASWYYTQIQMYCSSRYVATPLPSPGLQTQWVTALSGNPICWSGGTIPDYVNLSGKTLLISGNATIQSTQRLDNTTIISTLQVTFDNPVVGSNLRLVGESLQFNSTAIQLSGINSIAFNQSQTLAGSFGNLAACATEGSLYTELVSSGNISLNNSELCGVVSAGGSVTLSNSSIAGGVAANGEIRLGSNMAIRAPQAGRGSKAPSPNNVRVLSRK